MIASAATLLLGLRGTQATVGQIFGALGPIFIWAGAAMLVAGVSIRIVYLDLWPRVRPRLKVKAEAAWDRVVQSWDARLKTKENIAIVAKEQRIEGQIERVFAEPVILPPVIGGRANPVDLEPLGEAPPEVVAEPVVESPRTPPEPSEPVKEPPAPPVEETTPVPPPALSDPILTVSQPFIEPTPTADVEEMLGEQSIEPTADELRAMEAARQETLPVEVVEPMYAEAAPLRGKDLATAAGRAFG